MHVKAQISMVFHLDKCIGCHTCSLACKNIWTDRPGTEYMWWNNVETKPGTGYPTLYEDQEKYRGGWRRRGQGLELRMGSRVRQLANLFYNPYLPTLDDYYHPWTYRYQDLMPHEPGAEQPVARPVSAISGQTMEPEAGPNWDDDLGGSNVYAASDPNLDSLEPSERQALFTLERLFFFYLPRICNHCLNPGCVGACPAGAIYKRGEDGIVLVSQDKCRAWRMCISGCPYKKVYFNWSTGKSEKCILCFPRQETQQVPACMHACVGRIRYLGVLLYDADGIVAAASRPDEDLVEAQRALILDPRDPDVIGLAQTCGVHDKIIEAAQNSPVYRWVKEWGLALPQHPEHRTLPMLFYVPPLLPVLASTRTGHYELDADPFDALRNARVPLRYLATLLAGGNESLVLAAYRKLVALRIYQQGRLHGGELDAASQAALEQASMSAADADAIYRLSALARFEQRFVVPPFSREAAIESREDAEARRGRTGAGYLKPLGRGW